MLYMSESECSGPLFDPVVESEVDEVCSAWP